MDLNRFDLNLLIAFDALMQERNVTRAAKRLYISQSAMSHNLRKLRDMIGDPLLVPTSGGMKPTPRSLELEGPIRESLMSIQWNLNPPSDFAPQSSEHCFVIGSTDYVEYVILPRLLHRFGEVAPRVRVRLRRIELANTEEELEKGNIDVCILKSGLQFSNSVQNIPLLQDHAVALVRRQHPAIADELTLADYIQWPHVVIDSMEMMGHVEEQLGQLSQALRIHLQAPNFLSAPLILAESNSIATLPHFIAEKFIAGNRLKILALPFEAESFELQLNWHRLLEAEPAQQWFREQILLVAQELSPSAAQ